MIHLTLIGAKLHPKHNPLPLVWDETILKIGHLALGVSLAAAQPSYVGNCPSYRIFLCSRPGNIQHTARKYWDALA